MQPYDFAKAREAASAASRAQLEAERNVRDASRAAAEAEERYRLALAKAIVEQHAGGVAWTVAPDLARGDPVVAGLRRERDIAEGVREAMQQACWRRAADRRDTSRFLEWSMRRDLAEGYGTQPEPEFEQAIGGRK